MKKWKVSGKQYLFRPFTIEVDADSAHDAASVASSLAESNHPSVKFELPVGKDVSIIIVKEVRP